MQLILRPGSETAEALQVNQCGRETQGAGANPCPPPPELPEYSPSNSLNVNLYCLCTLV